jgi:hypothetical protein
VRGGIGRGSGLVGLLIALGILTMLPAVLYPTLQAIVWFLHESVWPITILVVIVIIAWVVIRWTNRW